MFWHKRKFKWRDYAQAPQANSPGRGVQTYFLTSARRSISDKKSNLTQNLVSFGRIIRVAAHIGSALPAA